MTHYDVRNHVWWFLLPGVAALGRGISLEFGLSAWTGVGGVLTLYGLIYHWLFHERP